MSNSSRSIKPDKRRKVERVGETFVNFQGVKFTIIEYINGGNVVVEFEDGYKKTAGYKECVKGGIRNPYIPSLYGVGYMGEGIYKSSVNGTHTKFYISWKDMLERCYNTLTHEKQPAYKGCTVCEEWHNCQNFAKWFEKNYYEIENQTMCLDKDILSKGNKQYSPETCVFVPNEINCLFTKSNRARGEYPVGAYYKKKNKKFCSQCKIGGGKPQKYLGLFLTVEEAFQAYKEFKEQYIKEVANKYKNKIPSRLYEAMMNYEVNIND